MVLSERIQQYVQRLPPSFQEEVLDFVEYLLAKADRAGVLQESRDWSHLSLSLALRGMEGEDTATYTTSDLKVAFS